MDNNNNIDSQTPLPFLQYSPFGVIPQKHKPRKWKLIINLSAPHGYAVNAVNPQRAFAHFPMFRGMMCPVDGIWYTDGKAGYKGGLSDGTRTF